MAGRPRKGEEPINREDIKRPIRSNTKAADKRAERAFKTAEKIYRQYESSIPNPLNIEDKELSPEALQVWQHIFSERGLTSEDIGHNGKLFKDHSEFILLYQAYCIYLLKHHFMDGDMLLMPSMFDFARWAGMVPRSVYKVRAALSKTDFDTIKQIMADTLTKGVNCKVYKETISIFCLKNWCEWSDKQEISTENVTYDEEQIRQRIAAGGYSKIEAIK